MPYSIVVLLMFERFRQIRRALAATAAPALAVLALFACLIAPAPYAHAQDGPNVSQTEGPPVRGFTSLLFYNAGGALEYVCIAESAGRTSTLTITNATNATPIVITTSAAHGLQSGSLVTISEVEGNTAANGTFQIAVTGSTTFQLKERLTGNSVAGNGGYTSNTGKLVTQAPRTNVAQWAIKRLEYDVSGNLTRAGWLEGSTSVVTGKVCDDRANYGRQ